METVCASPCVESNRMKRMNDNGSGNDYSDESIPEAIFGRVKCFENQMFDGCECVSVRACLFSGSIVLHLRGGMEKRNHTVQYLW